MFLKYLCLSAVFSITVVQSYRILGIIYMPSHSHQVVFHPLWRELSLRGHQVTVVTSDPMNDSSLTNLTEIDVRTSYNIWTDVNLFDMMDTPLMTKWDTFSHINALLVEQQLNNSLLRNIIQDPSEHFDLLIIEGFHSAHFAFAERFKCPFISVLSLDATTYIHEEIGNPSNYALYPDYMLEYQGLLTFSQRLMSLVYSTYYRYLNYKLILPAQQQLVEKYFGKDYPLIQDIYKNYSAYFLNINHIVHPVRPLLPNVVHIGGKSHIRKPKPLPKDLQTILDNSTTGAIYFSLGSNVKSKHISNNILESILSVFRELPYTVLWKFENDTLPNKPHNVKILKWFPQQDVLRHSNIKLFITQGGLQSLDEALHANVPMIGIPVMGDQKSNVLGVAEKGLGVLLEYKSITKKSFKSAILEVINNPKYRNNVKMYAELMFDQSQTGLDKAIWWTEYILRHKGAPHLRYRGFDIPWYQYYYLDIIGFSVTISALAIYLIYKLFFTLVKLVPPQLKSQKQKLS